MEETEKKTTAATVVEKNFTEQFENGSKMKIQVLIEIKDFSDNDCREILTSISSSARDIYLSVAEKININNKL